MLESGSFFGVVRQAMARTAPAALIFASFWGFADAATFDFERDQGQIFGTGSNVFPDEGAFFSQSVTTGITGYLAAIALQYELRGLVQPIQYSIYSGGNPVLGDPLYTELVTDPVRDDAGVWHWILPMQESLYFTEGDQFTFTFQAEADGVIFAGNFPPGYNGGELLRDGELYSISPDIAFISFVDTSIPFCNDRDVPRNTNSGMPPQCTPLGNGPNVPMGVNPLPPSVALMLGGFGIMGFAVRRRRQAK